MADTPETWHYGLVARWWAEFNTEGPESGVLVYIARKPLPAGD
jgi:hypothetical protein